jgi:hypothetical protein
MHDCERSLCQLDVSRVAFDPRSDGCASSPILQTADVATPVAERRYLSMLDDSTGLGHTESLALDTAR